MSNKDKPQADTTNNAISDEAFAALQEDICALYKQQDLERPSAAIDAAILLQAKAVQSATRSASTQSNATEAARNNVVKVSFWKKHRLPLSSAASVILIASVMLLNPEFKQHAVTDLDDSIPVISDTPAPAMMRSAAPQPQQAEISQSHASVNSGDAVSSDNAVNGVQKTEVSNSPSIKQVAPRGNVQSFDMQIPQQQISTEGNTATIQSGTLQSDTLQNGAVENGSRQNAEMQVIEEFSGKGLQSMTAPTMQHDSLDKAMIKLTELVNTQNFAQAERYMLTIEQRFPDIVNPEHPQHKQFTELKQQLTSQ
ncbi:hypothetical protein L2735_12450 [Shewanella olleyana]|uniref:hypothetical protein n=1 Tax=Shewanella olleyana TaxID=135626 RepID=UPI00200D1294|nr:hypothetical protein [Shewanella olleyana]MCL1067608.1 hypothetical protein [Shewanella olleyana]